MAAHSTARTAGLILLGGRSSRMGYHKHRMRLPGGTLLEIALRHMAAVAGPIALSVAASGGDLPHLPAGLPVEVLTVPDAAPELGPLQGLASGFAALAPLADQVVVMPVDMPFFDAAALRALIGGLAGHRVCLYRYQGYVNALVGAYRLDLLPKLERLLAEDRRRPVFIYEGEPTRILEAADAGGAGAGDPLSDMDTPEAYRAALLHLGVGTPGAPGVLVRPRWNPPPREGGEGLAALHAATAGEALHALRQLYPEMEAAGAGLAGLTREGADTGVVLDGSTPLQEGDRLLGVPRGHMPPNPGPG